MFTCDCHNSSPQALSVAARPGQAVPSISVPCRCFPNMSDPTAKWNSSISFLSRFKAGSEASFLGALVTEGKCIKEVKKMSGWSTAKAPPPLPHHIPLPPTPQPGLCFKSKGTSQVSGGLSRGGGCWRLGKGRRNAPGSHRLKPTLVDVSKAVSSRHRACACRALRWC